MIAFTRLKRGWVPGVTRCHHPRAVAQSILRCSGGASGVLWGRLRGFMGVPGAPPAPYLGVHAQEGVRSPAAQRRALERLAVVEVVVVLQAPDLEEICFARGGGHKAATLSSQIQEAPRSPSNFLGLFWGQKGPAFAGKRGTTLLNQPGGLWAQGWGDPKAGTCRAMPGACSDRGFPPIPWGLEIGAKSKKNKERKKSHPAAKSSCKITPLPAPRGLSPPLWHPICVPDSHPVPELGTAGTGASCPHVPMSPNPGQSQAERGCFHVQRPLHLCFAAPLRALGKVQEESQHCPDFGEAQTCWDLGKGSDEATQPLALFTWGSRPRSPPG